MYGLVMFGVLWLGAVWCGLVRFGAVWCGPATGGVRWGAEGRDRERQMTLRMTNVWCTRRTRAWCEVPMPTFNKNASKGGHLGGLLNGIHLVVVVAAVVVVVVVAAAMLCRSP